MIAPGTAVPQGLEHRASPIQTSAVPVQDPYPEVFTSNGVQTSVADLTRSWSISRLSGVLDRGIGLAGTFAWVKALKSLPKPENLPPGAELNLPEPVMFAVRLVCAGALLELGKLLWRGFYLYYDALTGKIRLNSTDTVLGPSDVPLRVLRVLDRQAAAVRAVR